MAKVERENDPYETLTPATERLWSLVRERGMNRRHFLQLLSAGGATAVLAACGLGSSNGGALSSEGTPTDPTAASEAGTAWVKDTAPFIRHTDGKSLEARLSEMQGFTTPTRLFFVRNNSVSPKVDIETWRLSVEGDAVANPLKLSYSSLRGLPSRTMVSCLECAGNHRAMFDIVKGQAAKGTQWGTGGVGNGEWVGVSLGEVLELAGVKAKAVDVLLIGMDIESAERGFRRVLPIDKAMHSDTILAYALNGDTLPRDHGYPLRAMVPGWVGASSIKWLNRIVVSSKRLWTRNNTTSYVLIGDAYRPEGEALGRVVAKQTIKSALALPWPTRLEAGAHRLHGYAQSPSGPITKVEWSDDAGRTWNEATVLEPQIQYSWARFEFVWQASRGENTIMSRATDRLGNTQPAKIPFNEKGYLFNQPVPHPIRVT